MSQTADGYGEFFMIEVESTCEFPLLLDRQGFLCLLLELFRSSRSRPVTLLRLQRPGKTFKKGASCKCDPNISWSLVSLINRSVGIPPLSHVMTGRCQISDFPLVHSYQIVLKVVKYSQCKIESSMLPPTELLKSICGQHTSPYAFFFTLPEWVSFLWQAVSTSTYSHHTHVSMTNEHDSSHPIK